MVQKNNLEKLIIIAGPTASGKTAFASLIAEQFNGEIISADSMQIYKEMNIGTAKITKDKLQGSPHHMIDIINPTDEFSVAEYSERARNIITDIISHGKRPIIAGGTGLYIDSLIYNMSYGCVEKDYKLREKLQNELELYGNENLHNKLRELDPISSEKIHPNNTKRVIRAIEIALIGNKNKSEIIDNKNIRPHIMLGLKWDRNILYERINTRVDEMFDNGLLDEVKMLYNKYSSNLQAFSAIGYKEIIEYLNNKISYEEAKNKIKKNTRNYAKRQLTWLRKYPSIKWFNPITDKELAIQYIKENI